MWTSAPQDVPCHPLELAKTSSGLIPCATARQGTKSALGKTKRNAGVSQWVPGARHALVVCCGMLWDPGFSHAMPLQNNKGLTTRFVILCSWLTELWWLTRMRWCRQSCIADLLTAGCRHHGLVMVMHVTHKRFAMANGMRCSLATLLFNSMRVLKSLLLCVVSCCVCLCRRRRVHNTGSVWGSLCVQQHSRRIRMLLQARVHSEG